MPTLGTLAAGIRSVSAVRRSEVYITELGDDDRPLLRGDRNVPQWRKFQYYPESISDAKQVSYQPKEVPGGSLPIYQYSGSGERTISFTAKFTTDVDHLASQQSMDSDGPTAEQYGDMSSLIDQLGRTLRTMSITGAVEAAQARFRATGVQERNPFIPGALIWLRRFMLPRYGENSEIGVPITKPPHKLLLHFTGTEIERFGGAGGFSVGGGGVLCVMTGCEIQIDALFPSGNIRAADVNLSFAEVPQRGGAVRFPSATELDEVAALWYPFTARAQASSSGASR